MSERDAEALAAYDNVQQEPIPTPDVQDGLPSGYFIVQVPGRDEWLSGAIGYSEYSQSVYGTDYIDAADFFDRPVHYPTAEDARQACWQDVTPSVGGQRA